MSLKFSVCVALLLYNLTFIVAKTTIDHADLVEKGNGQNWQVIGPRQVNTLSHGKDHHGEEDDCREGEYEWTNGTCLKCLLHNAECEKSRQCCSSSYMSCWRIGNNKPLCKCDPNYGWDEVTGECVYIPVPSVLLVTGYVALGAAVIIGVVAILITLCKLCRGYYYRCRGVDVPQTRRQFRQGDRRNARTPRQRHISAMVPDIPASNYPTKPPGYEDIFGAPTIIQAMPRQLTGSIRSLPPAYTPHEDDYEPVETIVTSQVPEPMTSQTEEVTSSQTVAMTTETSSQGVVNNAYETANHM